jgi:hypothetical protein
MIDDVVERFKFGQSKPSDTFSVDINFVESFTLAFWLSTTAVVKRNFRCCLAPDIRHPIVDEATKHINSQPETDNPHDNLIRSTNHDVRSLQPSVDVLFDLGVDIDCCRSIPTESVPWKQKQGNFADYEARLSTIASLNQYRQHSTRG